MMSQNKEVSIELADRCLYVVADVSSVSGLYLFFVSLTSAAA